MIAIDEEAGLPDDAPDVFPAVRCTRGEKQRLYRLAARLGMKPAKLARRRLFARKPDPFFSETLRTIAVRIRAARLATGPARAGALELLEAHILDLIADYNGVTVVRRGD